MWSQSKSGSSELVLLETERAIVPQNHAIWETGNPMIRVFVNLNLIYSDLFSESHTAADIYANLSNDRDNVPRNRASKSMDMVADESNAGSHGQRNSTSSSDFPPSQI
ncbi:unnamed protein product [Pleuronectes platessa]|uniref:Uncharacterized protein n=1 Tax=Pleuronectes platessa TaxID=8262 RepID=A0A9N7VHC5_PLEPL|nr:unnamed protein product [Pleuronectes platessa]